MFKQNLNSHSHTQWSIVKGLAVALTATLLVVAIVFAWTGPPGAPPHCPAGTRGCDPPITVGTTTQFKSGALGIGGRFETDTTTILARLGGNVGIGTTAPHGNFVLTTSGTRTWSGGIFAQGGTNAVALGELGGIAQIGGHNAAGTAWANLAINSGGGNVGIGTTGPTERLHIVGGNQRIDNSRLRFQGVSLGTKGISFEDIGAFFHITGDGRLDISEGLWGSLAPRFTIITGGNVGIGTTGPNARLEVVDEIRVRLEGSFPLQNVARIIPIGVSGPTGAMNWALRGVYQYPSGVGLNAAGGDLDLIKSLDGNTILGTSRVGAALGNVGIGTTAPTRRFQVVATAAGAHPIATAWEVYSDIAFKANVQPLQHGLREVLQLQPRSFNFNGETATSIGFVAQEVQQVIPEIVSGEQGQKGISLTNLTAVLTRAVQEQQKEIENLKARIEILENR